MEHEDELKMHREVVEIEGGRNLYNYTFTVDDNERRSGPTPDKNAQDSRQ